MNQTAHVIPMNQDADLVMADLHDKAMKHLPLEMIAVREGFNPRRYFSEDALTALVDSIKAQGVIQPIVVKPNKEKDGFHLIAGERRFRAATLAGIDSIPAIIRLVSEEEALSMAISENAERQDVSAAEEAKACHRMMALCDGDRQETALSLGWSLKKLESRLSLLHCSDNVLNALEQRQIKIGHAELLAGLSKSFQDDSLPGIVEKKISVPQLKEMLGRYAYKLNEAVFDVAGCTGCPHNSTSTADMFDASLSDGHCMNRECYDQKTKDHLTAKKEELTQEFPVIFMDVEKSADMRRHLVREGQEGVGREQYSACQGCAKFGALMLTEKGKEGQIEQGICFDVSCNSKMVSAYQKEHQQAQQSPAPAAETANTTASTTSKTPASKPKATSEVPKKVKTFVHRTHCNAAMQEVMNSDHVANALSLMALADSVRHNRDTKALMPILEKFNLTKLTSHYSKHEMVVKLTSMTADELQEVTRAFAATMAGGLNDTQLESASSEALLTSQAILKIQKAELTGYFTVDKAYLDTYTMSGLKPLLEEAGFVQWFDEKHGKGECSKKVLKGKRDDQIAAILAAGFDWTGFVPKVANLP